MKNTIRHFFTSILLLSSSLLMSQNVGVGTNNPQAPLHILKPGGYEVLRVQANNLQSSYLSIWNSQQPKGFFGMVDNENDIKIGTWGGANGNPTGKIQFVTESINVRMSILPSGRIGIGTTTPRSILDVNGSITLSPYAGAGEAGALRWSGTQFEWHDGINWQAFGGMGGSEWETVGNNIHNVNSGNTGIGTSTPNSKLHVNGSSNEVAMRVQVNSGSKLTVASNGGVSIGGFNDTPPVNGVFVNGTGNFNGQVNATGKMKVGDDTVAPSQGSIRYNTTKSDFEGNTSAGWKSFTSGSNVLPEGGIPVHGFVHVVQGNTLYNLSFRSSVDGSFVGSTVPPNKFIIVDKIRINGRDFSLPYTGTLNYWVRIRDTGDITEQLEYNGKYDGSGGPTIESHSSFSPLLVIAGGNTVQAISFTDTGFYGQCGVYVSGFLVDDLNY